VAVHALSHSIFFVGDLINYGGPAPNLLFRYNFTTSNLETVAQLKISGLQWNALISTSKGLIGVQQRNVRGPFYAYTASIVSVIGDVTDIGSTTENDTFVNFFWADYYPSTEQVYILAGDENSLYTLNAVLYTITQSGTSSVVVVDNSRYTVSNLHVDPRTGIIYSISPGLYGKNDWSIVTIDPTTGAVALKSKISIVGAGFAPGYGGGVYGGIANGQILHTFQWGITGSTVVAVLDIDTGNVLYHTDVDLGINSEGKLGYSFAM